MKPGSVLIKIICALLAFRISLSSGGLVGQRILEAIANIVTVRVNLDYERTQVLTT